LKTLKLSLAVACALACAASCLAQTADANHADANQTINAPTTTSSALSGAKAAARRALASHATDAAELPPATTPTTGKLVINIKIDVNPGLPAANKINCGADAITGDEGNADIFENDGAVLATRSGSTATCKITLPYGWFLASASKDEVGIGITVESTTGTEGSVPFTDAIGSTSITIPVPANGATTTENITLSI